ncbi:MAG: nitrite/sulfite reductase [Spirochaetota bacterium]|nr:nitrite/sulfite reductase [Spirochaetota bacterium]
MNLQYKLPSNLLEEIEGLSGVIDEYIKGNFDSTAFKGKRVPFGIYEQRKDNTYLVRIRMPGGIIAPYQLKKVADLSSEFGRDHFHFTTRGGIQIHYVEITNVIEIMKKLMDISLASRGGGGNTTRNIIWPADAGIDKDELFDVTPYGIALTNRLISEPDSWSLPRKFKIAFTGNNSKGLTAVNDVGFIAQIKDGKKGFKVLAAGGMGANSATGKVMFDFLEEDKVYFAAKAVKNVFDKYGNRRNKHIARLRFVMQRLGYDEFHKKFIEEYEDALAKYEPLKLEELSEMNRSEPKEVIEPIDKKLFNSWKEKFCTEYNNNLYNVEIPLFLGNLKNTTAKKLAELAEEIGKDVIRVDHRQNILFRLIPTGYLPKVFNFIQKEGITPYPNDRYINRMLSCAGTETCKLGICYSRGLTRAIANSFVENNINTDELGDTEIKISGCPDNCGQHSIADLGFFGKIGRKEGNIYPSYNIVVGADIHKDNPELSKFLGWIPAKSVPKFTIKLIEVFKQNKGKYKDFKNFLKNATDEIKELINLFSAVPLLEEDPNYYKDWESDKRFSVLERGEPECGVGHFELIESDFRLAAKLERRLTNSDRDADSLKQIIVLNSRALLITQGQEPQNNLELVERFKKTFIDKGIVNANYTNILSLIANEKNGPEVYLTNKDNIIGFSKMIRDLYASMDDSLRFKDHGGDTEKEATGFKMHSPV